ncbi:MAG: ribosome maturation factor RimM [Lachnospiraceae bacterium]|jgi:16S rRNA processing protein RimM|nr:ribosome maturation factor RimM [Lachnospiraceae bacterium]SEI38652.1 16S rRNA processing protein RimM [Lachnospiraceae bacterium A10]
MQDIFEVGVITQTHGLKGEVKVFPTTDDPKRFEELDMVMLDTGRDKIPMEIKSVRYQKNMVLLTFKGYEDINLIEKYKKCSLYVTRENAAPLEENEYYIADLIGVEVRLEDGSVIGKLKNVLTTAANDVYEVSVDGKPDVLIPAISKCIKEVKPEEGYMVVHLLPGMME